jgi:hypothetical protein
MHHHARCEYESIYSPGFKTRLQASPAQPAGHFSTLSKLSSMLLLTFVLSGMFKVISKINVIRTRSLFS